MHTKQKPAQILVAAIVIMTLALSGFNPSMVLAQEQDGIERHFNAESGKVSFIGPENGRMASASKALGTFIRPQDPALALAKRYAPEFGVENPERDLIEMLASRSDEGRVTVRYQQTYEGVPVVGGELIVNTNEMGDLYSMNGEVSADLSLPTEPEVAPEQARDTVLQGVAKWYQGEPADFVTSEPELWIYDESLLQPSARPVELVWRMEVTAVDSSMPLRELVLVNAHRGSISLHFNQVDTARVPYQKDNLFQVLDSGSVDLPLEDLTSTNELETTNSFINHVPYLAGATWYVATTGNDSNNCLTQSTPCATLNGAIAKAVSGGTIKVASGTYTGTSNSVVEINKNIDMSGGWNSAFASQTGETILDGQNARQVIRVGNASVVIERFTIINGSFFPGYDSGGGGIYTFGGANLTLNASTIRSNRAKNGGGIYLSESTLLTLNNTTVSGNEASNFGGGIAMPNSVYMDSLPILVTNNSTIADNKAWEGGGLSGTGNKTLKNTILARNIATNSHPDCSGGITTSISSIIQNIDCGVATGSYIRADPLLSPILFGASGYYSVNNGSPAIDAGNPATCLSTDQRGVTRPQGARCDIGSYEYKLNGSASSFGYVSGSDQKTSIGFPFAASLKVYITDNTGAPAENVEVQFAAPSSGPSVIFEDSGTNFITALSDGNGIATTAMLFANNQEGNYNVVATISGLPDSVEFTLINATLFYVAINGDDSDSCDSPASPCLTINAAINKTAGEAILVAEGTYTGNTSSAVVGITKDVTISGGWDNTFSTKSGMTILDGQKTRQNILVGNGITAQIENLNLIDGYAIQGAGIYNQGVLTIKNTAIIRNTVSDDGAGIYQKNGQLVIENATISNNTARTSGGGIYVYDGTVSINNSTITQNVAIDPLSLSIGGGLSNYFNKPVTIANTIVVGNVAESVPDCRGNINSGGFNLIGFNDGCYITTAAGDQIGTLNSPLNAMLGNLADNGGGTFTHALLAGSPAIDAGGMTNCATKDQRGIARPQGLTCDIGAYEGAEVQSVNAPVRTYTALNRTDTLPGTFLCDETTSTCTDGGDVHADQAHLYALRTSELYFDKHHRNSIDNNNMPIISSVHYSLNYNNAFWNGAQMVYGDANGFPLADDVVAHELTHGVTQYESNLFYYYHSGAINESFSDLWGEYFDQTNDLGNDASEVEWLMGEDVSGLGTLRSMSNPPAYSDPDKISSTYYYEGANDNGGVHTNSGINNKAVFLMVDGGTFNGKRVTALDWEKTGAIYYEAQTKLLTSGADYSDLYFALQQACTILIGQMEITAGDCMEVKDALDAVEMNGQPAANFNADAPLCPTVGAVPNITFADDLENGKAKWTFTNGAYARWQYDSPYGQYAQSGAHFLYADDYPDVITDARAQLASFVVPPNGFLHFAHAEFFAVMLTREYTNLS